MSIVTVMIYYEEHAAAEAISRCYDHHERSLFGVGVCRAVMPRVLVYAITARTRHSGVTEAQASRPFGDIRTKNAMNAYLC